ncbi:MAG: SDR family oxidoreductase [Spirochaetota bacterium]
MNSFIGKTAFVTGGSSGIGLAASMLLASKGADVIIFARNQSLLTYAENEIRRMKSPVSNRVSSIQLDVTDIAQIKKVMKKATAKFGAPDLLINCAGRALPDYFENITFHQLEETFKVNFFGIWNIISALLPAMKKKGGHIVNTSSMGGYLGLFGYTDYCASKFAMMGFSEALRSEVKQYGIRVSVLCPPDTDTPGFHAENLMKPEETRLISGNIKPLKPQYIARKLLKGIKKNQFIILPGFKVKLSYLIKRLTPPIMDHIINKSLSKKA